MQVYLSTGFLPTAEIVEIARAADALGYHGIGIPDHLVHFDTLRTPYPYTDDGDMRWPAFTDWPDPWVLVGALASCTTHLRFVTTVYVAALRSPYVTAKAVGTAAVLTGGRVELGLGVGWCAEEFELAEQMFSGRGRRTEELVELMRELWEPGWTEFIGDHYSTPRVEMSPNPPPIPVLYGGLSDIAMRRAARSDGWIADMMPTRQAVAHASRLRRLRDDAGLPMTGFTVLAPLTDLLTADDMACAETGGITHVLTQPWAYYCAPDAPISAKIDGLARYVDDFGAAFSPIANAAPSSE